MGKEFRQYIINNRGEVLLYIKKAFEKALNVDIRIDGYNYTNWNLGRDSSIDPDGGELKSPILNYNDAIRLKSF